MISRVEIEKLADLSRLKLSDEETAEMQSEMNSILAYVDKLKSAGGGEAKPASSANKNVLREDENPHQSGVYTERLLAAAPKSQNGFIKVKKIL